MKSGERRDARPVPLEFNHSRPMRLLRLEHPARYHILVGHRYSHWWLTLQSFKAPLVASTLLELLHYSPRILFVVGSFSDITILSTLGVHIYNTSPLLKVWRRHLHVQVGELRYSRRAVCNFLHNNKASHIRFSIPASTSSGHSLSMVFRSYHGVSQRGR